MKALSIAQKAVGGTGVLPILENILLTAEGQKVEISATNLEISISTSFPALIKNEGKTTLPAKTVVSWIGLISGDDIEVSKSEGEKISFQTRNSKTNIKGISADDFPVIPVVEKDDSVKVSSKDMKQALDQVVFAAASGGTRPVLSGVLIYSDEQDIVLVGTDSYRLSEKRIKCATPPKDKVSCIIPAKTLLELERILPMIDEDGGDLEIIFSKNQILFLVNGVRIISRLIDGQFPNYQQILPKDCKNEIEVNRQDFIRTIKRVGIFARENNNNIKLYFQEGEMKVTTDATEIGTEEAVLEVKNSNGENSVALNAQFLLDILLVLNGETVTLKLGEKLSPIPVSSPKSDGFLHIIMPLKV